MLHPCVCAIPAPRSVTSFSSIIFGGPGPLIAAVLFAAFGSGCVIALYILFCAIAIVATALLPDYTNRDISEEHDSPTRDRRFRRHIGSEARRANLLKICGQTQHKLRWKLAYYCRDAKLFNGVAVAGVL